MGDVTIRTKKLTDRELVSKWGELASKIGAGHVFFLLGGEHVFESVPVPFDDSHREYGLLKQYLANDGTADLGARADGPGRHRVLFERQTPFDVVKVVVPDANHRSPEASTKLIAAVRQTFEAVDLSPSLMQFLNDDLKRYYEHREANLVRLEQLTEKLITNNEQYRLKVDAEKAAYKTLLDGEHSTRAAALHEREQQLVKRHEELDLADAKSTRRKMRQNILDKLKPQAVMSLDRAAMLPIHIVFVMVGIVFLSLGASVVLAQGFDPLVPTQAVKLGLASLGFVGTMTVYFRWMDAWLRKGVDENLRMRQLSIDVDRSTWVVEVLSELKSETDAAIPREVLEALTRGLFVERASTGPVTHPVEDLYAALLGSSREVELNFPGGKMRTTGRAIQKATEQAEKQSP